MPSGSHIEVDKADAGNGVLTLDASALTAAAPLPSDAHQKSNGADCQEEIDISMKMDDGVDDVDEEEEAVDDQPAVAKITPKKASLVSPSSSRKPPSDDTSSKIKKSTMGSTKSSSTTTKKKTKKGPATPPPGNDRPSSKAAVATPSDSAEKAKKKGNKKQKSEPKKPTTTLHSFFSKAGPAAAKKKGGSIKSGSSSISSAAKIEAAKAKASSAAKSDEDCKIISSEVSTVKVQKSTTKANNDKLKATKKPVKKTKGNGGEGGMKATTGKPPKKSTNSKKNAASAKDVSHDMSSSTTTVVSDTAEELDDSPVWAVVMASRTHSAGGGTKRRGSRGGRIVKGDVGACDVSAAAVDTFDGGGTEKVAVEEVVIADKSDGNGKMDTENQDINNTNQPIDSSSVAVDMDVENNTSGSTNEDVTALDGVSANEEDIEELGDLLVSPEKAADSSVIAVVDTMVNVAADSAVEQVVTEAMEEDDCMALVGDPNFLSLGDIPDANDAEDMNIDCEEEEKAPVPEGTADDSANNNTDSNVDATVAVEEPATENVSTEAYVDEESKVGTETTQPQIDIDVVEQREELSAAEEEEDVILVDVSKASVLEELPADGITPKKSSTSSSTEKVEVQGSASKDNTEKATKSKKSTKSTPKSRTKSKKSPAASSSSSKSPKSKTATAAKGMDIVASLKKQAALSPKRKSTDTPIRNKASTSSSTPGAASKSDSKSPAKPLSEENASRLRDFTTLREKYVARATELGNRPTSDDFEEETLCLDALTVDEKSVELAEDGGFPDKLLNHLQLIVQGRSLPLSAMAKNALDELSPFITDARPLTTNIISSKIKLLAQRKSYLSGKPSAPSDKSTVSKLDCFENDEECYMWRWELSSIDLLPQKEAAKIKKARTMRRKLQGHHKSIFNLISAVDKATTWLQNSASKTAPAAIAAGEKLIAKVPTLEEKVLKFEREEETARLLKEAKLQKQKSKADELAEKQREKERQEEEKQRKKAEAAKEREEAKRKKNEEKELKKLKKKQEEEELANKNKKRMASFFGVPAKKKRKLSSSASPKIVEQVDIESFDAEAFRKSIDIHDEHVCKNPFLKLSPRSKESRQRKTKKVRVSVFVTAMSDNAFAPQQYDEEKTIIVPNRYKFLGFHEDVRPPYRGTWSKRSSIVTGRGFSKKDTTYLDYENDSELEWEEGDDEEGEDLADGDDGAEEEDDLHNEEDNDGWLAAEDDLGMEDDDDETRELRKKNLSNNTASSDRPNQFKARVLAPRMGGICHGSFNDNDVKCVIEGFTPQEATDVLTSHVGCVVSPDVSICLDAFPQIDSSKDSNQSKKDSSGKSPTRQTKEMTPEDHKTMAKFVHNSTHKSKDLLVTELLIAHPNIANSRAHALRELDVIADKKRQSGAAGALWEVKEEQIKKLGLKKKDLKKPPKDAKETHKKVKDPNAPKGRSSAYNYYSSAKRSDVKTANPDAQHSEIMKILSAQFKALSDEERAPWDAMAAVDKERFEKETAIYNKSKGVDSSTTETTVSPPKLTTSPSPKSAEGQSKKPSSANKKRKQSDGLAKNQAMLMAAFVMKGKKQKSEA